MIDRIEAINSIMRKYTTSPSGGGAGLAFVWGRTDCAMVMHEMVYAVTGRALVENWPSYSTPIGAKRALTKVGFASLSEFLDAHFDRVPETGVARPGDIVMIESDTPGFDALCLALGYGHVLAPSPDGVWHTTTPPFEMMRTAWRVA